MLNIAEELKTIYINDTVPQVHQNVPKDIRIAFSGINPIYADKIVDDSFSLEEGLIDDEDIRFGTCRASQIKFTLAKVPEDLKGKMFTIDQLISGYTVPLGQYKVDSAKLQDDLIFKDVVAYDRLKDIDVDVAAWYNALFPTGNETYTLIAFRSSLLAYLGIEEEAQILPNDDMVVTKTIDPSQISARTVLEASVELNGAFGRINRYGKFTRVVLAPSYGDYPTNDYPKNDYPISETDTSYIMPGAIKATISSANRMYREGGIKAEEYTVKEIDKLQIRSEENDIGAIVGTGTNTYIIQGNFLVYGKSAAELEAIARNAFSNMVKRPYVPYESGNIGIPYVEVGDMVLFDKDKPVRSYLLKRTLTGTQALKDVYEAPGNEERQQNFSVNNEIIQLQGKMTTIRKDVEGIETEVSDLAAETASKFLQTAEQIELMVDKNGIIAAINLTAEEAKIKASKITLEGVVTANNNFKILEDGTVEAINGRFSGRIDSSKIYVALDDANASIIGVKNGVEHNLVSYRTIELPFGLGTRSALVLGGNGTDNVYVEGTNTIVNGLDQTMIRGNSKVYVGTLIGGAYYSVEFANRCMRPLTGDWTTGTQSVPWDIGYFNNIDIGGGYIWLERYAIRPKVNNPVLTFRLGNSSYYWDELYVKNIYHSGVSGSKIGYFGKSPIARVTVPKLSTSADLSAVITKVNAILDAFGNASGYGLLGL